MYKIAVLDDWDNSIRDLPCWQRLNHDAVDFFSEAKTAANLAKYDILVMCRERTILNAAFVADLTHLKHVALTGRFSGQADLDALHARGVSISSTEGSRQAAAEHTIALILGLTKRLALLERSMKHGGWQIGPTTGLAGKILGILGLGPMDIQRSSRADKRVSEQGATRQCGQVPVSSGTTQLPDSIVCLGDGL